MVPAQGAVETSMQTRVYLGHSGLVVCRPRPGCMGYGNAREGAEGQGGDVDRGNPDGGRARRDLVWMPTAE